MKRDPEIVRCVECRHEYELPALGEEMACPECGGISWVSIRIPADDAMRAGYTASRADPA